MGQSKKGGIIFVISGPSGSGKTTLLKKLLAIRELKNKLVRAVSFTTRAKRSGEKEGKDYFFISPKDFERKKQAKKFLEWTRYLDYDYATPKDFIINKLKAGRHIALCLDFKGAFKIKRIYPKNTKTIFILPPTLQALSGRIRQRCNKTKQAEIQRRLQLAKKELLSAQRYDYCLINRDLNQVTRELKGIILKEINRRLS